MNKVSTKIGNVEITNGVAQFLENMMYLDINTRIVSNHLSDLQKVQDTLTRLLTGLADPEPEDMKACLSTIMSVRDQLSLLLD